jgi:hypothetical protein
MKRPSLLIAVATACLLVLASGLSAFAGVRAARPAAPVLKAVCVEKNATRALTAPRKGHCARGTVRRSMPQGPRGLPGPAGAPAPTPEQEATQQRSARAPIGPGETRTLTAGCPRGIATGGGYSTTGNVQILSSAGVMDAGVTTLIGWSVTGRNTGTSMEGLSAEVVCLTKPSSPLR